MGEPMEAITVVELGVSDGVTLGSLLEHLERLRDVGGFPPEAPVKFKVGNQYDRYDRITGHTVRMVVTHRG